MLINVESVKNLKLSLLHNIKIFLKFRLMISRFYYAIKYIKYWFFASHKKGHGIHSPFVYALVNKVFNNKKNSIELEKIYAILSDYLKNTKKITLDEHGAKTQFRSRENLSIRKIIKQSAIPKKYGRLLYNLAGYFKPESILELGTSVGISTAFIGSAPKNSEFITIDASEAKLNVAKEIANRLDLNKIQFIHGNFDEVLDSALLKINNLDFVFFDGNHRKEPTLRYFQSCLEKAHNNSVFIFDDIHWSNEMEEAWNEIKRNKKVRVSIDIFRMGIVFFRSELSFQHFVIKF